jgi:acetoacetate decarboxylase
MRPYSATARTLHTLLFTLLANCSVFAQTDEIVKLDQNWKPGWNYDEANWYHHASQGTMLMPYDWFMALEQPGSASSTEPKMFSDPKFLRQFGFLSSEKNDKYNPGNLPIGFAITNNWVDPNNTTPKPPVRVLGLTCAACHTGEVKYGNHRIRIEGGSSLIDVGNFQSRLGEALFLTNSISEKFQAFANRWFNSQQMDAQLEGRAKAALKVEVEKAVMKMRAEYQTEDELGLHTVIAGISRTDAMARIGNRVFSRLGKMNLSETKAPVNYPHIWDASWFCWVQYNASIRLPMVRNIGEALGVGAAVNDDFESTVDVVNLHLMEDQLSGKTPFSGLQAPAWPEDKLGEIQGFKTTNGLWKKGQELYKQHCIHCHYLIEDYQRTEHLDRAENKQYWTEPNQFGRKYMKQPFINYVDIGTDKAAVLEFYERVVYTGAVDGDESTLPAGEALAIITDKVRDYEYTRLNLSAAQQAEYDGYRELDTEEGAIPRLAYKARPLNGVWATAPYLHNGSIANLYEMLIPAKQRTQRFHLGSTEFDPKLVGFDTKQTEGSFLFDTTIPGNLNTGHEFRELTPEEMARLTPAQLQKVSENKGWAFGGRVGPLLCDDDRWALIEYVKSLGSPQPGQERASSGELQAINKLAQMQALMHRNSPGPDGKPHPEQRGQHPKTHGVVRAKFKVAENLDERYRVGIFASKNEYFIDPAGCDALIRFSNGDSENDNDSKPDVHGMAIKLLHPQYPNDTLKSLDFVLADNPTFFAKDAEHLLQFMVTVMQAPKAERDKVKMQLATETHPGGIGFPGLKGFKKLIGSPLDTEYYSQTPYKFGDLAVKYKVAPSKESLSDMQAPKTTQSKDGLREALVARLAMGKGNTPFHFDFFIQLQTDVKNMPIEDATREWKSSPVKLGTITIEPQEIDSNFGTSTIFSPWNALPEHRPLGGINRARQGIYSESVRLRQNISPGNPAPGNPAPVKSVPNIPITNNNPVDKAPDLNDNRIKGQLKKEDFGYSLPIDKELYPKFPYTYKNCTILTYEYETDPVAAAKFLPNHLTLDGVPRVKMIFATYPDSSIGSYNEVAQSLICRYVDENGKAYEENGIPVEFNYPLRMHVTSDRAMAAGREIAGIPKKMGLIDFSNDGSKYSSHLHDPNFQRVCMATLTQDKHYAKIEPSAVTSVLNYLSLRIVPGTESANTPKVREMLASKWILGPGEMWTGIGTLELQPSENDPYHRLPISSLNKTKIFVYRGEMKAESLKVLLKEF